MKYIKFIFILCSLLLLQGCPIIPKEYSLKIENNSNYDILVFAPFPIDDLKLAAMVTIHPADILYPDTSFYLGGCLPSYTSVAYSINSPFHWIFKHFKDREVIFENIDTLCVFLINVDTLKKYSINELNHTYNILQRYDMSLENMRQLNWTIVYPPDERMRGIKMYPPYGSPITTDTNKKE